MKLTLSDKGMHRYRENTKTQLVVGKQRACKGLCKKNRSINQFDGDAPICKDCQRRMPKEQK